MSARLVRIVARVNVGQIRFALLSDQNALPGEQFHHPPDELVQLRLHRFVGRCGHFHELRLAVGTASARADAPIVALFRAAGGIILGKTHTTEYAYLDPTDTVNPFNSLQVLEQVASFLEKVGAIRTRLRLGVDLATLRALRRIVIFYEAAQAHRASFEARGVFERSGPHWAEGLDYGATLTQQAYEGANRLLGVVRNQALEQSSVVEFLLLPPPCLLHRPEKPPEIPG